MLRLPSLESASYMKVAPLCPFRNTLVFSAESPYRNAATPRPSFLGKIWGGQGPKNVLVPGSYSLPTAKQMSLVNKFSEDLDGHLQAPRSQRLRARASNATIAPRHGRSVGNASSTNPRGGQSQVCCRSGSDQRQPNAGVDSFNQHQTPTGRPTAASSEYSRCSVDAEIRLARLPASSSQARKGNLKLNKPSCNVQRQIEPAALMSPACIPACIRWAGDQVSVGQKR